MPDKFAPAKYSLAMIVRNCAPSLRRCLASIAAYADDIVVVNTGMDEHEEGFKETSRAAEEYGARVFHFPWCHDFSKARQFSFDQCKYDHVLWLDSDDTVTNAKALDEVVRKGFSGKHDVDCIMVEYLYEHDKQGNCTTRLWRERVVDRRNYRWQAPVHECLCARFRTNGKFIDRDMVQIYHHRSQLDDQVRQTNLERNLECMKRAQEAAPDGKLPLRMRYYLGNTELGLQHFSEAINAYLSYVNEPDDNWPQIYIAYCNLSEAYRLQRDFRRAVSAAGQAIRIDPRLPTAYLQAAEGHLAASQFQTAIHHAEECLKHQNHFENEMVCSPKALQARPHFIRAICYTNMGKLDEARGAIDQCKSFYPEDELMGRLIDTINKTNKLNTELNGYMAMTDGKGGSELARHLSSDVQRQALVQRTLPHPALPKGKLSIAFFCPATVKEWDSDSIEKGIGGSEEAAINMARCFAQRGWHVEVFGNLGRELGPRVKEGVTWYSECQWKGEKGPAYDVVIFWRSCNAPLVVGCNSRAKYLWLHDVPLMDSWSQNLWNLYDKVMVLSEYHRDLYGFVPDQQIMMTRNAMDQALFAEPQNDPHRLIYASCPTRGLTRLLKIWPKIREEFPDAQLDVFYGVQPHAEVHRKQQMAHDAIWGTKGHLDETFKEVEAGIDQPGITNHGMVGQSELAGYYAKAGIWAYPTSFPEISCITAMKAQAHGCWPITVSDFALSETVKHGVRLDLGADENQRVSIEDLFLEEIRFVMNNPPSDERRQAMIKEARTWTWDKVAEQWETEFSRALEGRLPTKVVPGSWASLISMQAPASSTPPVQPSPRPELVKS